MEDLYCQWRGGRVCTYHSQLNALGRVGRSDGRIDIDASRARTKAQEQDAQ